MSAPGETVAAPATRPRAALLPAVLLGIIAFLVIRGPATLGPTSILWLDRNDRAMHALGWWFFRAAPWGWPPGASPLYGLEYANGVGLSDSLPLFAFPFKLLSPLLPEHFQYWGYWHLLCFALQAMFAALIARELGLSRAMGLVAAAFCLVQPAFLARLDVHMALSGHWTILAAIWLYLRAVPPRFWAWPLLLATVSAIHGYLLAMVFAIWLASLLQRLWLRRQRPGPVLIETGLAAIGIAGVLWAAGIFIVGSLESVGFGLFRMNLLGPFNPNGWSWVLQSVATNWAEWEGFNYFGLGVILLLLVVGALAGAAVLRPLVSRRLLPLVAAAAAMAVFALSHQLAIGSIELVTIPMPDWLLRFVSIFRSSGRMFWPLGYLVVFGLLAVLSREVAARRALTLAVVAFLIQIADTWPAWRGLYVGGDRIGASWRTPLTSPAWAALAPHYRRVRALPVGNLGTAWRELSWFALVNHMATDAARLGRVDPSALAAAAERGEKTLADGSFDREAIYVLDETLAPAAARHLEPGDLLATIDGLIVFARGGATILAAAGIEVPAYRAR